MKFTKKHTQNEEDLWRIRAFLREVQVLNHNQQLCWPVQRLDYWKKHIATVSTQNEDPSLVIWETPEHQIAAALLTESKADIHMQIHPAYSSPDLIEEMAQTAEAHFCRVTKEGKKQILLWAHDHDKTRQDILAKRGFQKITKDGWTEYQWTRKLDTPLPEFETASGYTIRSLGGPEEHPSRSWASWRAFHPDAPDSDYEGWQWYAENIQTQPLYRRDLDIVAIAPGGEIAAFTTLWYDDVCRHGQFEPVATVPEHQRKGLGKAVMTEGLRRIKQMGALAVNVSGFSEPANKLYAAVLSDEHLVYAPWRKEWED